MQKISCCRQPQGDESFIYEIGDTVVSTGLGMYIEGVEIVIEDMWKTNGFVRYFGKGSTHRQQDVKSISS